MKKVKKQINRSSFFFYFAIVVFFFCRQIRHAMFVSQLGLSSCSPLEFQPEKMCRKNNSLLTCLIANFEALCICMQWRIGVCLKISIVCNIFPRLVTIYTRSSSDGNFDCCFINLHCSHFNQVTEGKRFELQIMQR